MRRKPTGVTVWERSRLPSHCCGVVVKWGTLPGGRRSRAGGALQRLARRGEQKLFKKLEIRLHVGEIPQRLYLDH